MVLGVAYKFLDKLDEENLEEKELMDVMGYATPDFLAEYNRKFM